MWTMQRVARTASTNADVSVLAQDGAPEGTAVVADHQTSGRGRLERTWQTPAGTSLTVSFLLRPDDVPVNRWPWLPLLAGVAVVDAIGDLMDIEAGLKWPNDVLVGDRKLAGILVERVETPDGAAAVVGIGLNIRQRDEELPEGGTSLRLQVGADTPPPARDALLDALCDRLAERYLAWRRSAAGPASAPASPPGTDASTTTGTSSAGEQPLREAYRDRCVTLGRRVGVELPGRQRVEGSAVDVDHDGRLLVDTGAGVEAFGAGEIVHLRPL
ncbi:biotin--[acetyl-CoA-carboxylase] ligase [Phytoactinopolyspora halotolerans]|nr:biotin--[acetyl-CoA-carboxylase] ligase [Phytoactinopolyspora halotolerans]